MSTIYTTYVSQIASNHYHLSVISNQPEGSNDGDNIFQGKIFCLTDTQLRTISNLDHLSEDEILTIKKESKVADDSIKTLLEDYLSDSFDNLNRLICLVPLENNAECVLRASYASAYVAKDYDKECSYYSLIPISPGGVRTELTVVLETMEIKVDTTSNRRFNTIEHEKERYNLPPLMKTHYISQKAFDSILAYCITILRHSSQMLRYNYRNN